MARPVRIVCGRTKNARRYSLIPCYLAHRINQHKVTPILEPDVAAIYELLQQRDRQRILADIKTSLYAFNYNQNTCLVQASLGEWNRKLRLDPSPIVGLAGHGASKSPGSDPGIRLQDWPIVDISVYLKSNCRWADILYRACGFDRERLPSAALLHERGRKVACFSQIRDPCFAYPAALHNKSGNQVSVCSSCYLLGTNLCYPASRPAQDQQDQMDRAVQDIKLLGYCICSRALPMTLS